VKKQRSKTREENAKKRTRILKREKDASQVWISQLHLGLPSECITIWMLNALCYQAIYTRHCSQFGRRHSNPDVKLFIGFDGSLKKEDGIPAKREAAAERYKASVQNFWPIDSRGSRWLKSAKCARSRRGTSLIRPVFLTTPIARYRQVQSLASHTSQGSGYTEAPTVTIR